MPAYQTRNPLASMSPLRSIPLCQAPGRLLPMSEQAKAEWALAITARKGTGLPMTMPPSTTLLPGA
jgi:hypothetical protein